MGYLDTDPVEGEFWNDPDWRAEMMRQLTARGISARRCDEIIAKMVRHFREQHASTKESIDDHRA